MHVTFKFKKVEEASTIINMANYKSQIEKELVKSDWEITLIDTLDEWWIEEFWEIKSVKRGYPLKLVIIFEVDPMSINNGDNSYLIWNIEAFKELPKDKFNKEQSIASLSMTKRKFNVKLDEFMKGINEARIMLSK